MLLIGFIIGIIIALVAVYLLLPKMMFLENQSLFSFDETNLKIDQGAVEMKWNVPHQYDIQSTLQKHGYMVKPVRVFSLCKPALANNILGGNKERIASALMPCRISVYQQNDGNTYISRLNAAFFSRFLGKTIRKTMREAASESEKILEPIIKK